MTSTMELAQLYALAYVNESHGTDDGNMSTFDELCRKRDVARAALEQRIKELERDAKRLDWMERQDWNTLDFLRPIDAPHDSECGVWSEDAGQYMFGKTVREAVDRAMSEAALTKAVEISQEYKLP